jgi:hypothetical protein
MLRLFGFIVQEKTISWLPNFWRHVALHSKDADPEKGFLHFS